MSVLSRLNDYKWSKYIAHTLLEFFVTYVSMAEHHKKSHPMYLIGTHSFKVSVIINK